MEGFGWSQRTMVRATRPSGTWRCGALTAPASRLSSSRLRIFWPAGRGAGLSKPKVSCPGQGRSFKEPLISERRAPVGYDGEGDSAVAWGRLTLRLSRDLWRRTGHSQACDQNLLLAVVINNYATGKIGSSVSMRALARGRSCATSASFPIQYCRGGKSCRAGRTDHSPTASIRAQRRSMSLPASRLKPTLLGAAASLNPIFTIESGIGATSTMT